MNRLPTTTTLTSALLAAALVLAGCGGDDDQGSTSAPSPTADVSTVATTAPTDSAASPGTAPATAPAQPAVTTAPAPEPTANDDDPDTCDEAMAYIERLAAEGVELLELPQGESLDVMSAMNVLSLTCDPQAATDFMQRPDIVEFLT